MCIRDRSILYRVLHAGTGTCNSEINQVSIEIILGEWRCQLSCRCQNKFDDLVLIFISFIVADANHRFFVRHHYRPNRSLSYTRTPTHLHPHTHNPPPHSRIWCLNHREYRSWNLHNIVIEISNTLNKQTKYTLHHSLPCQLFIWLWVYFSPAYRRQHVIYLPRRHVACHCCQGYVGTNVYQMLQFSQPFSCSLIQYNSHMSITVIVAKRLVDPKVTS